MRRLASVDVAFTVARGAMAVLAPGCRAIDSDRNAVFGLTPLSLRSIGEHLSATIGPAATGEVSIVLVSEMVMDQGAGTARQHMERLRELEAEIDARLA